MFFAPLDMADQHNAAFLFATRTWLAELRTSFGSRAQAQSQCAKDWPRMQVEDHRSYVRAAQDYVRGNELLDYFGNQSTMAKPFALLFHGFPGMLVTQCGNCAFKMVVHDGGLTLFKRFLLWHHQPAHSPQRRGHVDAAVFVGPDHVRVEFDVCRKRVH